MSSSDQNPAYIGPWIDWPRGYVLGATITLSSTNAALLVAFLAVFVQFAGMRLWSVFAFIWHQTRVTNQPINGLQRQQEVILRNNSAPATIAYSYLKLSWAWRNSLRPLQHIKQTGIPVFMIIVFMAFTFAGSLFTSRVVSSESVEILLPKADTCGVWTTASQATQETEDDPYMVANQRYIAKSLATSTTYARQCYNTTDDPSVCGSFTVSRIPYSVTDQASCPLSFGMCKTAAIQFDTGLLDSDKLFGVNTGANDRVQFRKITTCAPLVQENFTTTNPEDSGYAGDNVTMYWYGPGVFHNYTTYTDLYHYNTTSSYEVHVYGHWPQDERTGMPDQSSFVPRTEIQRSDADSKIFFISPNAVSFVEESNDPIFAAHRSGEVPGADNAVMYSADTPMSVMNCLEQYQFCNPNHANNCTTAGGILPSVGSATSDLALNGMQRAVTNIFLNAVYLLNAGLEIIDFRQANLLAQQLVYGQNAGFQLPLPGNQWQLEVQDMHDTVLAMLQKAFVDYAKGPDTPGAAQFIQVPNDTDSKELCQSIRARTDGRYSNVSTLGMSIIIALGGFIILFDLSLHTIVDFVRKKTGKGLDKRDAWLEDGMLQLQRCVFEDQQQGRWKRHDSDIPITEKNDKITRKPTISDASLDGTTIDTPISPCTQPGKGNSVVESNPWDRSASFTASSNSMPETVHPLLPESPATEMSATMVPHQRPSDGGVSPC